MRSVPCAAHSTRATGRIPRASRPLDAVGGAATYTPSQLAADLRGPTGPIQPVLDRLDAALLQPVSLTETEFNSLVDFVRHGLLGSAAQPERLRLLIPEKLPSGRAKMIFQ